MNDPSYTTTQFNAYAAFLLGLTSGVGRSIQYEKMTTYELQMGWYGQDRWQITPKLTATLGLRYELYPLMTRAGRGGIEEYDPNTNTWTRKHDMPTARGGLTSATLGGLIHVTGGEDLGSSNTFAEHEVYDPTTDAWATYPPLPTSRHGLASAVVGGRWYVIGGGLQAGGGTYGSLSNLVEVFTVVGRK